MEILIMNQFISDIFPGNELEKSFSNIQDIIGILQDFLLNLFHQNKYRELVINSLNEIQVLLHEIQDGSQDYDKEISVEYKQGLGKRQAKLDKELQDLEELRKKGEISWDKYLENYQDILKKY